MIRKVTHISQSQGQHDLGWLFAPVAEDYVKTGWGLSNLEAAGSAGVSNPDYGYTPYIQNQYNHTIMNTVSTQMLGRRLKVVDSPRCVAEPQRCLARADAP